MAVQAADTGAEGEQNDMDMTEWLKKNRLDKFIDYFEENGLIIDDLLTYEEQDMNEVIEDCNITAHAYKKKFKNAIRKLQFEASKKSKKDISNSYNQIHRIVISEKESETIQILESKLTDIDVALKQATDSSSQLLEWTQNTDSQIENVFKLFRNKLSEREKLLRSKLHKESNKQMNTLKQTQTNLENYKKLITDGLNEQNAMILDPNLDTKKRKLKIGEITDGILKNINDDHMKIQANPISFVDQKKEVIEYISSICMVMVKAPATPILLSVEDLKNKVKIKWKLKNYDSEENNKGRIKVEWAKIGLMDNDNKDNDDEKEMDLRFNNSKCFDINNYNDNENEILLNIGEEKGTYFFQLYYDNVDWWSRSNMKSIKRKEEVVMKFYTQKHGKNLQFINDNIVKKINDNGAWATCLFGEEINDTKCNEFNLYIKLKSFQNGNVMVGYITSTIQNSVRNWDDYLGHTSNPENCAAYYIDYSYDHLYEYSKGAQTSLNNYNAPSKFKQDDTFKFSFNFGNNQLIIYHNGTKAETRPSLDNCKKFTLAFCMCTKDSEIEITNYEFL